MLERAKARAERVEELAEAAEEAAQAREEAAENGGLKPDQEFFPLPPKRCG
jgi:hypothetical protein